uniref:MFS transporter n=1 Tax=candidate division CPR3 bacterium TaxID=2268181 RepID=A0A7C4R336_UNCC3
MFKYIIPQVLKNKDFLKLWFAQIFGQSANQLFNFLIILKVYEMTGSNTMVSLLIVCITMPSVLFGVYAGVFADRFSQKKIMYSVNLLRAFFVFSYAFLSFHLWYIYVIAFFTSSVMQFFLPAEAARIPSVVKKEEYLSANSLYVSTNYAAVILGYALVGFVQLMGSTEIQFTFISVLFFISALILLFLPPDSGNKVKVSFDKLFVGIKRDFLESWTLIKSSASIYMPFIYLVFIWVSFGVAYVVVPSLAKEILNIPIISVSHLVIIPAVFGTVMGGILVGRLCKKFKREKLINIGILLIGLDVLVVSIIPTVRSILINNGYYANLSVLIIKPIIIFILMFMVGVGVILVVSISQTLLQENIEENHRGRVFGFLYMCTNVLNFLPVIVVGILADILTIKTVIFMLSLFVISFSLVNFYLLHIRQLRVFKKSSLTE